MANIIKARANSTRTVRRDVRPIAAFTAVWKGGIAACKNGVFGPSVGDPAEVVVGRFYDSVDNSTGAAGLKSVDIEFFRDRELLLLDNDAGALVTTAQCEQMCSILDDHTATLFSAAKGDGVLVYDVVPEGVWVELPFPASADDAGVPRIQSGVATLVAGTTTVTGVALNANSRITMSMRDPGAGALTGFAGFDAPTASRNVGASSFVINAIDATKTLIATAVSTVDYLVITP